MEFATWPNYFFTELVCNFICAQGTSNAETMLMKTLREQKTRKHMNTQRPTYAICNLALGKERRTTLVPSCWN